MGKQVSRRRFLAQLAGGLGLTAGVTTGLPGCATVPVYPGSLSGGRIVLQRPELDEAKKQELYAKYASHEMSFFLSRKDPAFFTRVIAPYLKNKKDPTFMDHWLLKSGLDAYTEAWKFNRLNLAERLLLGRQMPEQRPSIQRHVHDLAIRRVLARLIGDGVENVRLTQA